MSSNIIPLMRRCSVAAWLLSDPRTIVRVFDNGKITIEVSDDREQEAFARLGMDSLDRSREKFWTQTAKLGIKATPDLKKLQDHCCTSVANTSRPNRKLWRTFTVNVAVTNDSALQLMFARRMLEPALANYFQSFVNALLPVPNAAGILLGGKRTIVKLTAAGFAAAMEQLSTFLTLEPESPESAVPLSDDLAVPLDEFPSAGLTSIDGGSLPLHRDRSLQQAEHVLFCLQNEDSFSEPDLDCDLLADFEFFVANEQPVFDVAEQLEVVSIRATVVEEEEDLDPLLILRALNDDEACATVLRTLLL